VAVLAYVWRQCQSPLGGSLLLSIGRCLCGPGGRRRRMTQNRRPPR
jgi:hypothetical protein